MRDGKNGLEVKRVQHGVKNTLQFLQCDGENREGYEFLFPYNPYAFGDTPEDGSFSASFSPCTLNEGKSQEDLSNALDSI